MRQVKNRFQHLLIDNKHLLPSRWWDYQVLVKGQYETIVLLPHKLGLLQPEIRIGVQDGVYVGGYCFDGGTCNPGRKWGEYSSRDGAILHLLGYFEGLINAGLQSSWWTRAEKNKIAERVSKMIAEFESKLPPAQEIIHEVRSARTK